MHSALLVGVAATVLSIGLLSTPARADTVIKRPNAHPQYRAEIEPHGDLAIWHRAYASRYGRYHDFGDPEAGAGLRASIEVADPAFIPPINNTVAVSFGFDLTSCRLCSRDFSVFLPVTLQWNFFLTDQWSAFADLGFLPRTDGFFRTVYLDFMAEAGGRYHFTDRVALTMRVGYPFITVGPSFFVGR